MSRSRVAKNALAMLIVQLINILAPFLVLPLLSRHLALPEFSLVIVMLTACSLCYIVTDYGFNVSNSYKISKARNDTKYINALLTSSYVIKAAILVLMLLAIQLLHFFGFLSVDPSYIFWVYIAIAAMAFQPVWFFQGLEKMKGITLFSLSTKLSYAFMIVLLIDEQSTAVSVAKYFALANVLGALTANAVIYKLGYQIKASITYAEIKALLSEGKGFFSAKLAVAVYNYSNSLILSTFGSLKSVAFYGAGERIYNMVQAGISPVAMALYPYFSNNKDKKLLLIILAVMAVLAVPAALLIWHYAELIMVFIFGDKFVGQGVVLQLFVIAGVLSVFNTVMGYPAFALLNCPDKVNNSVWVGFSLYTCFLFALFLNEAINVNNLIWVVISVESTVLATRAFLFLTNMKHSKES